MSLLSTLSGRFSGLGRGIYKLDGSTADRAAPSAKFIKQLTGTNTDGNYWIRFPNGTPYQVYCLMSSGGGGWMNVNTTMGQYTSVLTNASTGAGSANMISTVTGTATTPFVGPYVTHNQAAVCGNCTGANCPSRAALSTAMTTGLGITEVRMQGRVSSTASFGSCPYFGVPSVSVNVAGTTYTGCAIGQAMGPFIDVYGPLTNIYCVYAWSVCDGSSPWTGRIEGIYVR